MPAPHASSVLNFHNTSFAWEMFFRKLGCKPRMIPVKNKTAHRNAAADAGTTFPRQVAICTKYHATDAPTTNTVADCPTGVGDICVFMTANNVGGQPVDVASIDIYRCTAYTDTTTFTWAKIVD